MSNIFLVIDGIKTLLKNTRLIPSERTFLDQLLHGNAHHVGLIQFAKKGTLEEFQAIDQEIKNHCDLNPSYKQTLNSLRKKIKPHGDILAHGTLLSDTEFAAIAKVRDVIYRDTVSVYSGAIMLPIIQSVDYRLGDSKGECSGYVLEWIQSFLLNTKPFNVDSLSEPLFCPIVLNSTLGKNNPGLNHGAPLTENIAHLQQLNWQSALRGMDHSHGRIFRENQKGYVLMQSKLPKFAQSLVNYTQQTPQNGFYLSLRATFHGHALGMIKDQQDNLHFLDVNSGWYRFKEASDFLRWLPFYFKTMNYHLKYDSCEVISFGFTRVKHAQLKTIRSTLGLFAKQQAHLIGKRISAPFHFKTRTAEEVQPQVIKQSRDDLAWDRATITDDNRVLASWIDVEEEDLDSARARAMKTFG